MTTKLPSSAKSRIWLLAIVLGVLVAFSGYDVLAQGTEPAVLLRDDFEDGDAADWELEPGWAVELEDGNHVLAGRGGDAWTWVRPVAYREWGIVAGLEVKLRRIEGSAQLNFRLGSSGTRYILGVNENRLDLLKSVLTDPLSGEFEQMLLGESDVKLGSIWHVVKIASDENHLKVYIDGQQRMDYIDEDPHLDGTVALEIAPTSLFEFDDVVIFGEGPRPSPDGYAWTRLGGPRGGIGYDVKIHPDNPDIIYVTDSNAGVHKSTDGGERWQPMNNGITSRAGGAGDSIPIFSLTIDHNDPDVVWVGTQGMKGVYKSTDGGENWIEMDHGIEDQPVMEIRSFTVDPVNSDVVYLGGNYSPDPANQLIVKGFIYKTTDGGKNWSKILDSGALVRWIILDPTDTDIIYASTGIFDRLEVKPDGVLKSTDGGKTWRNINNGISNFAAVSALAMHPENPKILYAGTGKWVPFYGSPDDLYGAVYKTTDGGESWVKVFDRENVRPLAVTSLYVNPANPEIVYATPGFMISTDGGENWSVVEKNSPNAEHRQPLGATIALAVHPDKPETIFADAYGGGVSRSTDGGKTWHDASKGYSGAVVYDVAFLKTDDPYHIMAATHAGVYTSGDGGTSWEAHGRPGSTPFYIAVNPLNADEIMLGDRIDWAIRKSRDGGKKFYDVLGPINKGRLEDERMANAVAYAPSNPRIVYAGFSVGPHQKGGPSNPGPGVYKSVDGGETWTQMNSGLEQTTLNVLAVAVHPVNADMVFAGTEFSGLYMSMDGGRSWQESSAGLGARAVFAIAIDPSEAATVYAGTDRGGVFKSVDGGASWQPAMRGIPFEASVTSIVVDPSGSQRLFAADSQSGVYLSLDGGESWAKINEGLTHKGVTALAAAADGSVVYASTAGGGVFRLGAPPPQVETPTVTPTTPPAAAPTATASVPTPSPTLTPSPTAALAEPSLAAPTRPDKEATAPPGSETGAGISRPLLYIAAAGVVFAFVGWGFWQWRFRRSGRRER